MKEFLEKFGLTEILSHFFPGFIALFAILVWGLPEPEKLLGPHLGSNEFLLGALLLISAYAVGLVVNMWALYGAQDATQKLTWPGGRWTQRLHYFGMWLRFRCTVLAAGIHPLAPAGMLGMLEIHDLLEGVYGAASMNLLPYPTTQLTVFRAALCERVKEHVEVMLVEPEVERRRYLFSIGVALAMMVLALSILARLVVAAAAQVPALVLRVWPSWRTGLPFALFVLLALVVVFAGREIERRSPQRAQILPVAVSACLAGALAVPHVPALRASKAALLGVIVLAVCSLAVTVLLRRDDKLGRVLLWLFWASVLSLAGCLMVSVPLVWVDGIGRWDAQNQRWPVFVLAGGLAACYAGSRLLRGVACRCLERELVHTLAIVRLFARYF